VSVEYRTVVGLGNPGSRYAATRHNIGFAVVDLLRAASGARGEDELRARLTSDVRSALNGSLDTRGWHERDERLESSISIDDWSATLVKPQTFMNRSGEPLQGFLAFKKIPLSEVIVVHDEIDLPLGSVRIKVDGGEGGHNGLRSISSCCGGRNYVRIRVGIGKPPPGSPMSQSEDGVAAWVLSRFSSEEGPFVEELAIRSALAVVAVAKEGLRAAQNRFNR
jgi:PTH1 family peptidyl-tRNA hydrolase